MRKSIWKVVEEKNIEKMHIQQFFFFLIFVISTVKKSLTAPVDGMQAGCLSPPGLVCFESIHVQQALKLSENFPFPACARCLSASSSNYCLPKAPQRQ